MKRSANERYHDRVAPRYDDIYGDDPYHVFCRELSHRHLLPHLPRDLRAPILDAACGTGLVGLRLARSGFPVDFLDLSAGMLEQVRAAYAGAGLGGTPRFVQADLEDAADHLPPGYALITAQGDVLSFVRRPERALAALARLLRPGGIVQATLDQRFAGLDHFLDKGDVAGLERFVKDGRTEWLASRPDERFPTRMFTAAEVRRLFAGAGLEIVSLIGRPVLPLRRHRALLEDRATARRLLRIEERIRKDDSTLGRAAHLEVLARRP